MPRIGRSFPAPLRRTRGPLSSLNFVPRISPHPGYRPRQQFARDRVPTAWLFPAPPGPAPGLPTLVAEAAWTTDPLALPTWAPLPRCRALKMAGNHRSAALGRFDAGVITGTFSNNDRSLEPLYAAGANYPNVKQRKRIRVRAVAHAGTGTTYPIAVGFIEKVVPTYPKDWKDAVATITASDAFRLFAGVQLANPYQAAVLGDSPTAYYRFLESVGPTAADLTGSGNTATYSPTGITWGQQDPITDDSDHAILFDGRNGYVTTPTLPGMTNNWSVEGWFKVPAGAIYTQYAISSDRTLSPSWNLTWGLGGAPGGTIAFTVNYSDSTFGQVTSPLTAYNDNTWHHVVVAWTSLNVTHLYVDGVQVAQGGIAQPPNNFPASPMVIGPADNQGLLQSAAEIALYVGTTLSGAQVANHYAARNAGLGDTSDTRVTRLLDGIGWPSADRDLDAGVATLTSAGDLATQKLLDHFRLVDATEGGCLTMSRDGKVMMRNRHSIQTGPARNTVSQATFGDQGGAEIGWTGLGLAFDDVELANRVTITRRNGITAVALDRAQITASGTVQDHSQTSLSGSDTDAIGQALWILQLLKNPNRWRFEKVVVPLTDTNQDAVLGREIWDRVTVAFTPPGGAPRISQDVLIVGIDHDVTKPGHWDVTFHTTGTDLQVKAFVVDVSFVNGSDLVAF